MLKILATLVVISCIWIFGFQAKNFPRLFGGAYGISEDDPLGTVADLTQAMTTHGFLLESGDPEQENEVTYSNKLDSYDYPNFRNEVKIGIGEEAYIYSFSANFVSTQHGYSPAPVTKSERFVMTYWKKLTGSIPKLTRKNSVVSLTGNTAGDTLETDFNSDYVKCHWKYSEADALETVTCETK
jgi:hypothetical protein